MYITLFLFMNVNFQAAGKVNIRYFSPAREILHFFPTF